MVPPAALEPEKQARTEVSLALLGPFDARVDDKPLPHLRSRKGQWLLAALALRQGREVDRRWLAGTLWPESTERWALANLRQLLHDLRRALGSHAAVLVAPTARTLSLAVEGVWVDVAAFDA